MTWTELLLQSGWRGLVSLIGAGGGGAVIAVGIFRVLGQKWLEHRFKEQLERLKHEQNKEIEGIRQRVQALFSRISKIHEKEFEVLPKAWFLLHDAHGKAAYLMATLKQRPDFDRLSDTTFEAFLKESGLSQHQQEELKASPNRAAYYSEAIFWIELNDASVAQGTFHNYIIEHRIFMTEELWKSFSAVDGVLSEALIEHRIWKQSAGTVNDFLLSSVKKVTQLSDKIGEVERAVQKRLSYEDA